MTALTRAQKDRAAAATSRAGHIRFGMQNMAKTIDVIAKARAEADHLTLGYSTWQEYVDGEFGAPRLKLPLELRNQFIEALALAGASQREIGYTLGVSQPTVHRALAGRDSNESPAEDEGAGQPVVDAMKQALVNADERAQDHRDLRPGEADGSAPSEGAAVGGPAPDQGEVGRSSHKEVPTSPTQDPSRAQGFSGEEAGTSAGTDVPAPDPGVAAPVEVAQASPAATSGGPGPVMPPAGPGSSHDNLVDTPVGPMSPGVAAAIGADTNAAWRKKFFDAIVAARKVMRAEVEEVVRLADDEAVDELHRVARDLSSYSALIAEGRAALHPNVTPIRRAK